MTTMKYFIVVLLITGGVILYLNRAYAHIFSYLNAGNPGNPTTNNLSIAFRPVNVSTSSKIIYVSLGDSLTAGVGAPDHTGSYPFQLAKLLADDRHIEVAFFNLGQPGAVSKDVLNSQIPQVAELYPDIVTVAIGINDMHNRVPSATFQKNITSIVDQLSGITKHLNIITIPYLGGSKAFWPPYQTYYDWQTKRYNNLLRAAIPNKNVTIIDLYSQTHERSLRDSGYYSTDDFHPSAEAYTFWSKIIYDHLDY